MNSPVESPKPHQAARRKLVRGVFAAPAIMTVCSGNAFANTSNLRCLVRHATDGTNATPVVAGSTDAWARVQLHQTYDGTNYRYYVSGSQVRGVFTRSSSVFPVTGSWQEINVTSGAAIGAPFTTFPITAPARTLPTTGGKYAVVRFDSAGNVVGVGGAGSTSGGNVGASCWNSFKDVL